ncbi:MAG: hypothetical protein DHS20C09_00620 [marine bacterium B5-7]|nr:MAG: hypothetical protein DHS20C09_00620 [marine bacterium B5-7]
MRLTADDRIRKNIAHEAAKLVAQEGLEDFLLAKKKAAQQLNINNKRLLPSNSEIEVALIEYQSLFHNAKQQQVVFESRKIAYKTMLLLVEYNPLLVGSVLSGTANENSEIIIHVFSDSPEVISLDLENNGIPISLCERRLKIKKNNHIYFTALKFIAGNINIVLIVLPHRFQRNAPLDPITQRPMKRATLSDVKRLIDDQ